MNHQQPSSGDLKDIQRQHKLDAAEKNGLSSSSNSDHISPIKSPASLLERRQSNRLQEGTDEESFGIISPMPTGAERMAALRDLGATFKEGQKSIAKVATPTETIVPSFVDSDHLEQILHQKHRSNLADTCKTVSQ